MLPLDPHVEIVNTQFPKYVVIEETEHQEMNPEGVLFKETFQNNYCYLRLRESGLVELTLFKSDHSQFDQIASDYLFSGIDFRIKEIEQTKAIINALFS